MWEFARILSVIYLEGMTCVCSQTRLTQRSTEQTDDKVCLSEKMRHTDFGRVLMKCADTTHGTPVKATKPTANSTCVTQRHISMSACFLLKQREVRLENETDGCIQLKSSIKRMILQAIYRINSKRLCERYRILVKVEVYSTV